MCLIDDNGHPVSLQRWLDTSLTRCGKSRMWCGSGTCSTCSLPLVARQTTRECSPIPAWVAQPATVALAAPSLFTMYPESPRLDNAWWSVSRSRPSPDIVGVIEEGLRGGHYAGDNQPRRLAMSRAAD